MTSVEFEKMLSAHPRIGEAQFRQWRLRDLIYDHYAMRFTCEEARQFTKEYTDALAQMMGVK